MLALTLMIPTKALQPTASFRPVAPARRHWTPVRNRLLILLLLAGSGCAPAPPQYPPDSEMLANLNENLPAFEELIQMFREDRMRVVHTTWMQPASGITPERWSDYKERFKQLHLAVPSCSPWGFCP